MELRDFVAMLRTYWVAIGVLALVGLSIGAYLSASAEPRYRAQSTVLVTVQYGTSITDLNQGSSYVTRQVQTYAEIVRSPVVLGPVVQELGLRATPSSLRQEVSTSIRATALIDIAVTWPNAREAEIIANAVAESLATAVEDLSPEREDGSPGIVVNTISPAGLPSAPYSPNIPQNLAMGLAIGLLLGLGWAALRRTLDTKVRSDADVRALTDIPVLGAVSFDSKAAAKSPEIVAPPLSIRAEEYRQLRTSLQYVNAAHRPRSIVVTSSRGGEGKTVTSVNLALAIAETGAKVCLVDADLRRPSVAAYLGIEGSVGLTTALIGQAGIEDVLQPVGDGDLSVMAAGHTPPNPSELLGSSVMVDLATALESQFDIVLYDSAPLLPVTDAAILSKISDGVLLVVGGTVVTREQLVEASAKLETIGAPRLGVVLNRAQRGARSQRAYGYSPHKVTEPSNAPATSPAPWAPVRSGGSGTESPDAVEANTVADREPPVTVGVDPLSDRPVATDTPNRVKS